MTPSPSSPQRHCKLCMAVGVCDVPGCPLAFLAESRQPCTPDEAATADRITEEMQAGGLLR